MSLFRDSQADGGIPLDGNAIVYCERAFGTPNGKTAHGLVRRTARYAVLSIIDSRHAGADAGMILDGQPNGIPVVANVHQAADRALAAGTPATHFVVGLAPDGGRLPPAAREDVTDAICHGLNVDCGLHDYLNEDLQFVLLAQEFGVHIRDVRKPPPPSELHFFSGKIEEVTSFRVAVLGTDSAVGKRTTAWLLIDGLRSLDISAEMIGTGQTAWMQGVGYGIILDSLINDFLSGEIEHAVWSAWHDLRPQVLVLEGQGSLLNPAYPGGFELLAAGRPDVIVLQHAPARKEYDGFPGYAMHPLEKQIQALELIADKPVVAITLNHEDLDADQLDAANREIAHQTGLPVFDVLREGPADLAAVIQQRLREGRVQQ
jgi:uncharacterized NAD-dependent epimerase/dehydratase family protein